MVVTRRGGRYWLWFLVFAGVFAALTYHERHGLDGESVWLLGAGVVGFAHDVRWIAQGRYARAYELLLGLGLGGVGVLGVMRGLGIQAVAHAGMLASVPALAQVAGLNTALYPSLLHAVIGLTAITQSLRADLYLA